MILPSTNDPATPQTVLAYCLALDAYARFPVEAVRQALSLGGVPPEAPYERWSEAVERAMTLVTHPVEVPPCSSH